MRLLNYFHLNFQNGLIINFFKAIMTRQQRASIILSYFNTPSNIRSEFLDLEMQHLGLSENGREAEKENIKNSFNNGIKNLNSNQLNSQPLKTQI